MWMTVDDLVESSEYALFGRIECVAGNVQMIENDRLEFQYLE